jgi:hypothetical protein
MSALCMNLSRFASRPLAVVEKEYIGSNEPAASKSDAACELPMVLSKEGVDYPDSLRTTGNRRADAGLSY